MSLPRQAEELLRCLHRVMPSVCRAEGGSLSDATFLKLPPRIFCQHPQTSCSCGDVEHTDPSCRSCTAGLRCEALPLAWHSGLTAGLGRTPRCSPSLPAQAALVLHPSSQTRPPGLGQVPPHCLPVHWWALVLAWLAPATVLTLRAYSLPASSPWKRKVEASGRRDTLLTSTWESLR